VYPPCCEGCRLDVKSNHCPVCGDVLRDGKHCYNYECAGNDVAFFQQPAPP